MFVVRLSISFGGLWDQKVAKVAAVDILSLVCVLSFTSGFTL